MSGDHFDPAQFRARIAAQAATPPDPLVGAIPTELIQLRPRASVIRRRFAISPMAGWGFFHPEARVLLLLLYLGRSERPDAVGGWFRFTALRAEDAQIEDRHQRRRALAALEEGGAIEVDRSDCRSPLIRIAPGAAELLQPAGLKPARRPRKSGATMVRIINAETGEITEAPAA